MKLLALLLATLLVAPFAPVTPRSGQGDAAAAVAAAGPQGPVQVPGSGIPEGSVIFTLSGSGKLLHLEGGPQPGVKPFKTKVKDEDLVACINGTGTGCDANSLDINVTTNAFLIWQGPTTWLLANNAAGDDAVTLEGLVDGKGGFVMAGTHTSLDGDTLILLRGKVKFVPGTLTPLKISGKIHAVSTVEEHYGSGSFKAVVADS